VLELVLQDAWHIVKWIWAAVFFAYLTLQVIAVWRLKGDLKRRSTTVLTVMIILIGVSDAIRAVFFFENRMADRIGMLTIGVAAIVATIVLARMFARNPSVAADNRGGAEHYVEPLKLS
jgi:hypothetical protein